MLKSLLLFIFLSIVVAVDVETEEAKRNLRTRTRSINDKTETQERTLLTYEKHTPALLKSDVVVRSLSLSQISGLSGRNHVLDHKDQPNGLGDEWCEGGNCAGYLLEFTRTNTDCSGRGIVGNAIVFCICIYKPV